jgi:hypothetical protein
MCADNGDNHDNDADGNRGGDDAGLVEMPRIAVAKLCRKIPPTLPNCVRKEAADGDAGN